MSDPVPNPFSNQIRLIPQNGTPLTSPKDAIILGLIQQYEKNKKTAMQSNTSNTSDTFTIDTNIGADISSTQTGSGSTDNDQYEDGANPEISETEFPLHRQLKKNNVKSYVYFQKII